MKTDTQYPFLSCKSLWCFGFKHNLIILIPFMVVQGSFLALPFADKVLSHFLSLPPPCIAETCLIVLGQCFIFHTCLLCNHYTL